MSDYDKQYYAKNRESKLKKHNIWSRTLGGQFAKSRALAKRQGHEWSISIEDYSVLRQQNCHYCDGPLPVTSKGLDRINNSIGYTIINVLPCCSSCNRVKNSLLSVTEMAEVVKLLKTLRNTNEVWK